MIASLIAFAVAAAMPSQLTTDAALSYTPATASGFPEALICYPGNSNDLNLALENLMKGHVPVDDGSRLTFLVVGEPFGFHDAIARSFVKVHFDTIGLARGRRVIARLEYQQMAAFRDSIIAHEPIRSGPAPYLFQQVLGELQDANPCR